MTCSIASFNLAEICDGTIALLKNPKTSIDRILDIIKSIKKDYYISPILIANPRNAFEKAFIKNIYNNVLTWNSSRIIIDSHINKLFLLDKNYIESREDLRYKLSKIAESSDRIIDSIEDYEY
jgi:ABC-type methionine transport system ATPase subunit